MAGLLGSVGQKIGGLLGDPALQDALWLTIAAGADPRRADQLREEKRLSLDDERKRQYLDLQMQQAQIAAEQARQAQARQQYTQWVLGSNLSPEVINSPAFQMAMRQQAAAHGDISALEQGGVLAPIPQAAESTSLIKNLTAMGIDPSSPQGRAIMLQSITKPQTSINMGAQFPDLPKDHMWVNPLNPAEGVKPIPNSPTDLSQRAAAEKEGTGTGNTIARIDNVMSELDRAISGVGYTTTGLIGAATKNLPGSPAKDLSGSLTTIKANIGFNELQAMREASPTGGALGQVAVQELEALQSVLASLEQDQSPERVAENLNKVKNHYARWRSIVEQAKQNGQGAPIVPNSSPSQSGGRVVDFNSLP